MSNAIELKEQMPMEPLAPSNEPFGLNSGPDSLPVARPFSFWQLLRFKRTILIITLAIAIPVIIAAWALIVPVYQVEAQIRVRPIIQRLVFKTDDNGQIPFYTNYLNTQVSVIMSPTVLQRVLDLPEVQQTDWYQKSSSGLSGGKSPIDRLYKVLSALPRGMTEIIDISMADSNPQDAVVIVNAVLDQYLRFVRENSDQVDDQMYQKILEEHNALRTEIEGREKLVAGIQKELGTGTPEELISQRRVRLDKMESQLSALKREIATGQWQVKELESMKSKDFAISPTTQPRDIRYEEDGEWRKLYIDYRTLQHQIDIERERLGESHPKMIELNKSLKLAGELMESRQTYLDKQAVLHPDLRTPGGELKTGFIQDARLLRQRIKQLQYEAGLLAEDVKNQQAEFNRAFESAQMLSRENQAIQYKKQVYDAIRARLDEKEMERNRPASIEVLSRAFASSEPYKDRRWFLTVLAIFGGLGCGLGVAFLRATTNQMIHEADDLQHTVRMPFLGQLPLYRSLPMSVDGEMLENWEYIRMVRTALLQRLDNQRGSAILVTSACDGAGKTSVCVMLARSLTQCGKKVLLVDTDIRNPALAQRFGVVQERGLLTVLTSESADGDCIVQTSLPGLYLLPAGRGWTGKDQELLADGAFSACLTRWRHRYDIIILDCPPILPVADTRIICRQMDGAIMVVREGHCRRSDVVDALAYIGSSGGKLLGTVFLGSTFRSSYIPSGDSSRSSCLTGSGTTNPIGEGRI